MQRPETAHESLEALLSAVSTRIEISSLMIKMPVLPFISPLCDKLFQTQVHTREFLYLLKRFLPQGNLISYALNSISVQEINWFTPLRQHNPNGKTARKIPRTFISPYLCSFLQGKKPQNYTYSGNKGRIAHTKPVFKKYTCLNFSISKK